MQRYLSEGLMRLLVVCLAIRLAYWLLEPLWPLVVTAVMLLVIGWVVVGRPRGLS